MVALVCFLVIAFFSDRLGVRGPFLIGPLICLIVGYAILISVDSLGVRYFACFGTSSALSLEILWLIIVSRCDRYLSHNWSVLDVAARQCGSAL